MTSDGPDGQLSLTVDGREVSVADDGRTLLEVLRGELGLTTLKDGCSPQGQCGCCTVWIDGAPRVACVTPVRRVAGRTVTTLDGLSGTARSAWADALVATGGSQCGFCTPGIIMRLAALFPEADPESGTTDAAPARWRPESSPQEVNQALLAHLCRCTGWQSVIEAAARVADGLVDGGDRDFARAARRAELEGGVTQRVGPEVTLGRGGFANDLAPADSLVAVPDGAGDYSVGSSLAEARKLAGKVQGRNTTVPLSYPVEMPEGSFLHRLRTTWVEPAYLEPDASWCEPGGEPASPVGNGGAFGGKLSSPVADDARRLADEWGRTVSVVWSREDVVRHGPKRPPVAGGIDASGHGRLKVGVGVGVDPAAWDRITSEVARVAPSLVVEAVPVPGPAVSLDLRAAVWAEAAVLAAVARAGESSDQWGVTFEVTAPNGATATARMDASDEVFVTVAAGSVLDPVVLTSYCIGAVHQGLGWVRSEGVAVDDDGEIRDLTIRSYGVLQARAMPKVVVAIEESDGPPVNGSDAVMAAVAAAAWWAGGCPEAWPIDRAGVGRR
jgi:aerobic-type carbon monoxide dehydrogenase small subunit (CoxS/CutS family)